MENVLLIYINSLEIKSSKTSRSTFGRFNIIYTLSLEKKLLKKLLVFRAFYLIRGVCSISRIFHPRNSQNKRNSVCGAAETTLSFNVTRKWLCGAEINGWGTALARYTVSIDSFERRCAHCCPRSITRAHTFAHELIDCSREPSRTYVYISRVFQLIEAPTTSRRCVAFFFRT